MKVMRKRALCALLAMVAALGVGVSVAGSASAAGPNVLIGWVFDGKGNMAPFDGPALAAAMVRVKEVNARGGVQIKISTCDTQGNAPDKVKACALNLLGQGAKILFVTCDVDYATPAVTESINRGLLTIAPCIGTDQMGPKRFGAKGSLAFSFGNVAQDEGSAMAQWAYGQGLAHGRDRHQHPPRVLQERRAGVRGPLQAARRQDRRARELRDRRQQRQRGRQPARRQEGRRVRDGDRVRRAARAS